MTRKDFKDKIHSCTFFHSDLFYVRNHLPVPKVEVSTYKLKVYDANMKETSFSLEDIKTKFPKVTVTATVMCAGNRRGEMVKVSFAKHCIKYTTFCNYYIFHPYSFFTIIK